MATLFRLARSSAAAPPASNLTISSPTDPAELEAERIAGEVMRMPTPAPIPDDDEQRVHRQIAPAVLHRACAACEDEEKVHRSATGDGPGTAPPLVGQVLSRPGQPLPDATRAFFEPRLGADLSAVRVHTDTQAARSADAVRAKAYTVGSGIAFAAGQYAPQSESGKGLLAHELVHVMQQEGRETASTQRSLVQRQDDLNQSLTAEELDRCYRAAVAGYDWRLAAELLNGFNRDDILARLAELTREQIEALHLGAIDNPRVGPDSQVARLTVWAAQVAPAMPVVGPANSGPTNAPTETGGAGQGGFTDGEIIAGVLIGAAVVGGALLLFTPGGQALGLAVLVAIAPVGGEVAVVAGAPVVAEVAVGAVAAEALATTAVGGTLVTTSVAAPVLVTTAVAAPAVAGASVTTVAASSWAATAAATLATATAATTLSSDSPPQPEEKPDSNPDSCQARLGLIPGINDRWHIPRQAISGQTTVLAAAFRLDAGVPPPVGQDTSGPSQRWVRSIGMPDDDAGHVIANRFGGRADFNSPDGNIFPEHYSFNRGTMRSYDTVVAGLHRRGCDVCVNIGLIYDSPTALRPTTAMYTYIYRSAGTSGFNPPIHAILPNP